MWMDVLSVVKFLSREELYSSSTEKNYGAGAPELYKSTQSVLKGLSAEHE